MKYDSVYIYETDFQKSIIEILLNVKPVDERRLIIDARNYKIKIGDNVYNINLNGYKRTLKSLLDGSSIPVIETRELICTAFTGINCRLFPVLVKHDYLSIIDDGTGTPVIIKEGRYILKSFKRFLRLLLAGSYTLLKYGKPLPIDEKTILRQVWRYYTIYPFIQESDMTKRMPFAEMVTLKYFSKMEGPVTNVVGFVSTGAGKDKSRELMLVQSETGAKPVYYPHPHEDVSLIDRNLVSDVVRPDGTLEKYFIENGVPSFLFGEISTVFINLKLMCCPSYMTVFYRFDKSMQAYYDLFQSIGINMRELK